MTEVRTTEYSGPERRRELIIGQCACHLKHEAALSDHKKAIKAMDEELRQKVSWKLFALFVSIVVMSTGFLYKEIRATSSHVESRLERDATRVDQRLDQIDKGLQVTTVAEQIFESNTNNILGEIKEAIRDINVKLDKHQEEVRKLNGYYQKQGE